MNTQTQTKPTYAQLLSMPQWRAKRAEIINRDSSRCKICGSASTLEVHHRQYHIIKATGDYRKPWQYDSLNLVTLCSKCHQAGHGLFKVPVFKV